MVFVSYIFLFGFLPPTLLVYYLLPFRFRSAFLTAVSYVFYGWWRPDFTLLLAFSTVLDWFCGSTIVRTKSLRTKKLAVACSVVVNLGLLGYFKYFNFGMENLNAILVAAGSEPLKWTRVILPIGISFYTFQTITYTVDLYRGDAVPARRFIDYACYVALFPQLVAGPIVRYTHIADQLRARDHTLDKFSRGCSLFMFGFAKKVLIADNLAAFIGAAYASETPGLTGAWLGAASYGFQVYYDFSGYSDMAVGLGLMMGFELMKNFDAPFRARNVTDTWRRWHISLSTWLRDYLYIPLGGNKHGPFRTYFGIAAVMILGGFWHGAQWTFIFWGIWNGFWLILERMNGRKSFYDALPVAAQIAITHALWTIGMIFFRAEHFGDCGRLFKGMFGMGGFWWDPATGAEATRPIFVYTFIAASLVTWGAPQAWDLSLKRTTARNLLALVLFFAAVLHMFFGEFEPFLYYRF